MAQLTCQNLCAGYDGRPVLQGLSFELLAGDYLCIVGENGSGKSTLMKTILGLQTPISGRILTGDGLRKNEIGYLPQQTVVQKDFPASVREIVLSGCQGRCGSRPFYNKEEKKLAVDAMEKMQITRLARRCYADPHLLCFPFFQIQLPFFIVGICLIPDCRKPCDFSV